MDKSMKNLGEAELEIMQVIWHAGAPSTSMYILEHLRAKRSWQLSTLMTSLSRLADKGFLSCDRSGGGNMYSPLISEDDYRTRESRNFLERLYGSSLQSMVATLYNSKSLDDKDVAELRRFLDSLEEGK